MKLKKTLTWAAVLAMAVTPLTAYTAMAEETSVQGEYLQGRIKVGDLECRIETNDPDSLWLKIGACYENEKTITEAVIPSSVKYTVDGKEYTLPVKCIGATNYAEEYVGFAGCVNLKSVTIPETVTVLGVSAFSDCESLTSIKLPKNMYAITLTNPFLGCTKLESIEVDSQNERLHLKDGVLFGVDSFEGTETLISYPGGKTDKIYVIPNDVENITGMAFNNSYLTTIYVPKSANALINSGSFYKCPNLTDLYFEGTEEEWSSESHEHTTFGDDTLKNVTVHFNAKPTDVDPDWTPDGNRPSTKVTKFANKETGIEITAASGVLPEGVTFNAKLLDSTADSNKYDLSFTDAAGNEVQPNGSVTVSIPLPADWDTAYAYRVEGDKKTLLQSTIKNGKVVFITDHFSVYMLTTEELDTSDEPATSEPTESESSVITPGDTDGNSGNNSGGNSGNDQADTGIALAAAPVVIACAAVIAASKKRK